MPNVAILLSSFNGQKYIKQQINSILIQQNVTVDIYVRDDGSSDSTITILNSLIEKNKNIFLDKACNVGVGNSFMQLLYSVPNNYDYYAFSDQDDVWEKDKIINAINLLEKNNKLLYGSNQKVVDLDCNFLNLRYKKDEKINITPLSIICENMIAGCTMVFNNKLFNILTDINHRPDESLLQNRIHDVWVAAVASLYNGIIYDENAFIKYRQHGNNVVGAEKPNLKKRIKNKIKKISDKNLRCGKSKLARELVKKFPKETEKFPLIKIFSESKTIKGKNNILKHQKIIRKFTNENIFDFFFKVILNLF